MAGQLTDGSDPEIVAYLASHTELLHGEPAVIAFTPATWHKWLPASLPGAVLDLPDELGGKIGRPELEELAGGCGTPTGRLRLFVGALVWGLGRSNGRMLPGLARALESHELRPALTASLKHVRAGHPAEAYEAWSGAQIPGLGEPFFTKWLYAAGLQGVPDRALRPLVADSRVWASLHQLGWSTETTTGGRYRSRASSGYAAYLAAADRWGAWLRQQGQPVDVFAIEAALFAGAGKLPDDASGR